MAPIVSGEVVSPDGVRRILPPPLLTSCVEWLKESQADWGKVVVPPPTPVSSILITHSDGARTYIQLYTGRPGWDKMLTISSYDKDRNLKFNGIQEFSESEIAPLKVCAG